MNKNKIAIESLASDLKRVALLRHRGSIQAADRFSAEAKKIGIDFEIVSRDLKRHSIQHNFYFLQAMAINYKVVVSQLIESEDIIICDSSEIRALAFILDCGNKESIADTKNWIKTGTLTHSILPGLRIVLGGTKDVLWKNLQTKAQLDYGDPQSADFVNRRITSYWDAIDFVKSCNPSVGTWWQEIQIQHNPNNLSDYLFSLINGKIIPLIKKRIIK